MLSHKNTLHLISHRVEWLLEGDDDNGDDVDKAQWQ